MFSLLQWVFDIHPPSKHKMLGQRRRRWSSINTMGERLLLTGAAVLFLFSSRDLTELASYCQEVYFLYWDAGSLLKERCLVFRVDNYDFFLCKNLVFYSCHTQTQVTTSLWIWKGVSATLQSGRYTLSYPKGRQNLNSETSSNEWLHTHAVNAVWIIGLF